MAKEKESEKVYKSLSFVERLSNPKYRHVPSSDCSCEKPLKVLVTEDVYNEKLCLMEKKTRWKTVDRRSEMSKYHAADFKLENMLAAGVPLKSTSTRLNALETVDNIENAIKTITAKK